MLLDSENRTQKSRKSLYDFAKGFIKIMPYNYSDDMKFY